VGVSLTLVSIYLINQREVISQKLQSIIRQPAADQNAAIEVETITTSDRLIEASESVTLEPLPVKLQESEAEMVSK
jgi:hypothetical protein